MLLERYGHQRAVQMVAVGRGIISHKTIWRTPVARTLTRALGAHVAWTTPASTMMVVHALALVHPPKGPVLEYWGSKKYADRTVLHGGRASAERTRWSTDRMSTLSVTFWAET